MKSGLTRVIAKSPLFADKLWMVEAWHIASDGKKQKNQVLPGKKDPEIVGRRKGNRDKAYCSITQIPRFFSDPWDEEIRNKGLMIRRKYTANKFAALDREMSLSKP